MKSKYTITILFLLIISAATAAQKHPVIDDTVKICSNCHDDDRVSLDHKANFINKHKFFANYRYETCFVCHSEANCFDCHAKKEQLKPSEKNRNNPDSIFSYPHSGDFINQHKIDGKINPAQCFKCHGRKNNERCKLCHH